MKVALEFIGVMGSWLLSFLYLSERSHAYPVTTFCIGAVISLGMTIHLISTAKVTVKQSEN